MKIAFISEMNFNGKIPADHRNMRTEFAWMHALNADHYSISQAAGGGVLKYEHVFIIFPKGKLNLSAEGSKIGNQTNPVSELLAYDIVGRLKQTNQNVYYLQEGPSWWFNDYSVVDQINFYNLLASVDRIFAHNEYDVKFYKGLVPGKPVETMPTLMIEDLIGDIEGQKQTKAFIGGNFARWYGGFQSYLVAQEFDVPIWAQSSHAKRENEDQVESLAHIGRVDWVDWINKLSEFKYAVHLMPTIAAGTFSLNCAYLGIPCIGNEKVDTQRICHPELSVDVEDVEEARNLAALLKEDEAFYNECSEEAKRKYSLYYGQDKFLKKMKNIGIIL
tara:strand:- start:2723 stop:3718 length:996 start_codon:yes stop_codon:yes gene_type:complete